MPDRVIEYVNAANDTNMFFIDPVNFRGQWLSPQNKKKGEKKKKKEGKNRGRERDRYRDILK